MRRYKFITMVMLVLILVLSACQSQEVAPASELEETGEMEADAPEPYEMVTVTINDSAQINYAPIYFAQTEGYFEEYGIELEVLTFNRVTEAVPLLVSGQLDVYAGSISAGLINIFGQEPYVKAVADRGKIIQDTCTFQAILVRKDLYESGEIMGPADLEGRIIAATSSAVKGFHLGTYLAQAGLTFDDVELTDIPSPSLVDAFANKAVDVIVTPEITLTRLLTHGNAVILSTAEDDIGPYQSSILAFGPRLIRDNPEIGARFMAAYLKGVQKYNEGKTEENLLAISEKTGEDIELLRQACWIPIREDGLVDFSNVDPFQQWSFEMDQLDATITEEDFWDPSFLEAGFALLNDE